MNSKAHGHQRYVRAISPPEGSFFLFGARGTGKTEWLKDRFRGSPWIDLLDPRTHRELSARPERLLDLVPTAPHSETVVIDEVQRLPELLPVVQLIVKDCPANRFVVAASSARRLRRSIGDLLSGPMTVHELFPLTASELGPDFRLDRAATVGTIPLILASENPADALQRYLELIVREEVQAEALTRDIGGFYRLLEAASFTHADVMNLSSLARAAEIERKTAENYLTILEDLFLVHRIPPFREHERRRIVIHPKLYFTDAGVFASARPADPLARPRDAAGQALEGLVAMHLRAHLSAAAARVKLFYWRTSGGTEVDFVLSGPGGLTAIDVKGPDRLWTESFRGLAAFGKEHPQASLLLLHRGGDRFVTDGVLCLPVEELLLDPGRYLAQEPKE